MRLRNLIILTVIVPLFVILVGFSLVAIKSLEDNVRSKLQTEVEIITRTLSSSLSYAVTPDSSTPLEELYSQRSLSIVFTVPTYLIPKGAIFMAWVLAKIFSAAKRFSRLLNAMTYTAIIASTMGGITTRR